MSNSTVRRDQPPHPAAGSSRALRSVWAFVLLGRPLFLIGGIALQSLGVVIARYSGVPVNPRAVLWAQIAVTAIQWMTQYINEYYDQRADAANPRRTWWSGGSAILVQGRVRPVMAVGAAVILAAVGVGAAAHVSVGLDKGPLPLVLVLLAGALSWFYSAPPLRLLSTGWGEVLAALVVAALVPLLGYSAQAGRLDWLPVLALAPLVGLQFAMLMTVGLPDAASDATVGKRTLAVRLGSAAAARITVAAMAASYASLPVVWALGLPDTAVVLIETTLPLAGIHSWWLLRGDGVRPACGNRITTLAVFLMEAAVGAELLAFSGLVVWNALL